VSVFSQFSVWPADHFPLVDRRGFFDSIGSAIGGLFGGGGGGSGGNSSLGKIGSAIGGLFGGSKSSDVGGKIGSVIGSVLDKDKSTGEKIGSVVGAVLGDSKAGGVVKKIGDVAGAVLDKDKSLGEKIGAVAGTVLGDSKEAGTIKKVGEVVGTVLDKGKSKGDKIGEIAGEIFGDGSKIDKIGDAVGAILNKDGTAVTKIGEAVGAVLDKDGGKIGKGVGAVLGGGAAAGGAAAAADGAKAPVPAPAPTVTSAPAPPPVIDAISLPQNPEAKSTPAPSSSAPPAPTTSAAPPPTQPTTGQTCSANAPTLNDAAVNMIRSFEGFVASPEPDPIGLPTVGFGHKCIRRGCSEVPFSFPLSEFTASQLLQNDAKKFTSCLSRLISNNVKLNDNQFGALTSWAFNVGCGTVQRSTLLRRLNRGEEPNAVAARELPRFNRAGGRVLRGLTRRRNAEVMLFQTPSAAVAHPTC
jgi:GH24 family phage-related lysozyme (muramidase)